MAAGQLKDFYNPWGTLLRWVGALILMGFAPLLPAQTIWNAGTGNWFTPGNWTPNTVPDTNTKAQINNAGTAQITAAGAAANTLTLGTAAGQSGTVSVSGAGTLTINGTTGFFLTVGDAGTGTLGISGGATVTAPVMYVGSQTGSSGGVTISGLNSFLTATFDLEVGRSGTGTLTVSNDANLATGVLAIGNGTGSGTMTVDGTSGISTTDVTATGTNVGGNSLGSTGQLIVTGSHARFTGGGMDVGSAGSGTFTVSAGGIAKATSLLIGDAATGTVLITGTGSKLTVSTGSATGTVTVGGSAVGNLNVEAGATLISDLGVIGKNPGGVGTATITGAGSSWALGSTNTLIIGQSSASGGSGALNILNGGKFSAGNLNAFTDTAITVDGTGSQLLLPNDFPLNKSLYLGSTGVNKLDVTNGGTLATGSTILNTTATSSLTINLAGTGSSWTQSQFVGSLTTQFGGAGMATFKVSDHAMFSFSTDGQFNVDATGSGTANLTVSSGGSFSAGTTSGSLHIGQNGTGSLTIDSGGIVNAPRTYIGENTGAVGTASLSGAGSTWNAGELQVGSSGHGTVDVSGGATFTGAAFIGPSLGGGGIGSVTLSGAGTTWVAQTSPGSSTDQVSVYSNSSLTVQTGASLSAEFLSVGGNGTITIQGTGTQVQSSFNISSSGTSVLKILDGAVVNGVFAVLAGGSGAGTVATVDGATTQWLMTAEAEVGVSGKATLNIQNGAKVSAKNIYFGYDTGGNGIGNVIGTGSSLTMTGYLRVADWTNNFGTLTISQGGTVTSVSGASAGNFSGIGSTNTSTGAVVVTGAGSSWTNTGAVYVGNGGTTGVGTLTVQDSGTVTITGAVSINAGSTLNIGTGALPGTFSASSVASDGLIHFNHTGSYSYSVPTSGAGAIVKDGSGTTIITGTHTYTGATTVNAGLFQVDGVLGNTAVSVASGATLGGVGSIGGPVTIQNGGHIAPGDSPGTMTVASLILNSGSILDFQLGTPGVVGMNVNDLISVTGNLNLDGTLNISNVGGFGVGTYRLFDYGGTLTGGTLTFGTLPAGFTAADFTLQTSIANQVNLIVTGGSSPAQYWNGPNTTATLGVLGGTGTWNNVTTNWTDSTGAAPTNWLQGTAIFSAGTGTATLGANITATEIQFVSGSGAYTVAAAPGWKLTITGAGITNSSGVTQSFVTGVDGAGNQGIIAFQNSATAGSMTTFTNNGSTVGGGADGGITQFSNSSTAGSATITNNPSTASGGNGGLTLFFDTSSAGSATVINNASAVNGAVGGGTQFVNSATAGSANFTNNGPTIAGGSGGSVQFGNTATAGSGTFTNNGAGGTSSTFGGLTIFHDTSTAASGNFTSNGATASGAVGGITFFKDSSTAGSGTFVDNGGTVNGALGGRTEFDDSSQAGSGAFTNNGSAVAGGSGGLVQFNNTSTAGTATFTNNGGSTQFNGASSAGSGAFVNNGVGVAGNAFAGGTGFTGTATAGSGTFTNTASAVSGGSSGSIIFFNSATAGSGTFISNGGAFASNNGGEIEFFNTSTAANGNFTNKGGTVPDAGGGSISFNDASTAGSGVFTNNGGVVTGAFGGFIQFNQTSTAGTGTFTNNGGPTAGDLSSGGTFFVDTATGGSAHFTNNGATVAGADSGNTGFYFGSTAASGTFINNGGMVSGADGGKTIFDNSATAANGIFTNNGASVNGALGGSTQFFGSSTAGSATITNNASTINGQEGKTLFHGSSSAGSAMITNIGTALNTGNRGGGTVFFDTSLAGTATITINGGGATSAQGGYLEFHNSASADRATVVTNGATANLGGPGHTTFYDTSSAGSGTFTNNGGTVSGAPGGVLIFANASTAGSGVFTNNGAAVSGAGGSTLFFDDAVAGSGTFTNNAGTANGFTKFFGSSNAGGGIFTNNGAGASGLAGGATQFVEFSTAGDATITNNGATVAGAGSGNTQFFDTSTAGNATLIANAGTGGGQGGLIAFLGDSTGGTARVIVGGNGSLDISPHNAPGVTIGSVEGNGNVFLGSRTLTVGSNNANTTFSGVMADGGESGGTGGSLTKIGIGTLTLAGINTYTGNTNINGGTLFVDGSIASANTYVNAGGTLGGNGTIFGNVFNSGVVSPGHSPGILHITGNYTQTSGGTLVIEVASSTSFDKLNIDGHASLGGTLRVVQLNGYQPKLGDKLVFLTAGGGVSGTFSTTHNDFLGTLVRLDVVYEANDVALVGTQNSFTNAFGITTKKAKKGAPAPQPTSILGITPNQIAVALALDSALFDSRQGKVLAFLDGIDFNTVPHQLDKIAPEELTAIYTLGFAQLDAEVLSLQQRLMDIRIGARAEHPAPPPEEVRRAKTVDKEPVSTGLPEEEHYGFFLTETGDFASAGDTYNANGFNIKSAGTTLGVDVRLSEHFVLGLMLEYERSDSDLIDGGHLRVDGGKAALYAMYHDGGFFTEGLVGGGYNSYDTSRSALQGIAHGRTDGGQLDTYLGVGFDKPVGPVVITPIASLLYSVVGIQGFDEFGSLEPLHINSQNESSMRGRVGVRVSHSSQFHTATLTSSFSAQWQHEFLNDDLALESSFGNGAGAPFVVHGPRIGHDSALLTGAFNVQWSAYAAYVAYQADLGRKNYENQTVLVGFRVSW